MLKEKPMISLKQAEKLVLSMTKHADHGHQRLRDLSNFQIEQWFKHNNIQWKTLISSTSSGKPIPFVENLIGYEWSLEASDNTSITVYQFGHETAKLIGSGQISILDYHTKFVQALEARSAAIKKGNYQDLLSCATHGVASIESYITSKANIWNKSGKQPIFSIERTVNLDEKLNEWLFAMTGYKMNQSGATWNHFMDFRTLNNNIFKHNTTGSHAASYNDMVKLINKFRTGIAEILFRLHEFFKEPIPSKIIRGIYLPDVFYTK